jgi:hypothetical protein
MFHKSLERLVLVQGRFANHCINFLFNFVNKVFETLAFLESQIESGKQHLLCCPIHIQENNGRTLPTSDSGQISAATNSSMISRPPIIVLAKKKALSQFFKPTAWLFYETVQIAVTGAMGEYKG